jgi:molybdopterin-guanine dinucleotide biosynthesis protein
MADIETVHAGDLASLVAIAGESGSGKTHLANRLTWQLAETGTVTWLITGTGLPPADLLRTNSVTTIVAQPYASPVVAGPAEGLTRLQRAGAAKGRSALRAALSTRPDGLVLDSPWSLIFDTSGAEEVRVMLRGRSTPDVA